MVDIAVVAGVFCKTVVVSSTKVRTSVLDTLEPGMVIVDWNGFSVDNSNAVDRQCCWCSYCYSCGCLKKRGN